MVNPEVVDNASSSCALSRFFQKSLVFFLHLEYWATVFEGDAHYVDVLSCSGHRLGTYTLRTGYGKGLAAVYAEQVDTYQLGVRSEILAPELTHRLMR